MIIALPSFIFPHKICSVIYCQLQFRQLKHIVPLLILFLSLQQHILFAEEITVESNSKPQYPGAHCLTDTREIDLGKQLSHIPISHTFTVTNAGTQTLTLDFAKKSCSCLTSLISSNTLEPSASTVIAIGYQPPARQTLHGPAEFSTAFKTNDPDNPFLTFVVKVYFVYPVDVDPPNINFGSLDTESPAPKEMIISCSREGVVPEIREIQPSSPFIQVKKLFDEQTEKFIRYHYEVNFNGPCDTEYFQEHITIINSCPKCPLIEVPIQAQFIQAIQSKPSRLLFGSVDLATEPTLEAELRGNSNVDFTSLKVVSTDPRIQTSLKPNDIPHTGKLEVKLIRGAGSSELDSNIHILSPEGKQLGCVSVLAFLK